MAPPSKLIQYSQLLSILVLAAAVASEHLTLQQAAAASDEAQDQVQKGMMGRPGCRDKCGGMSIPFPFGMDKPDCFLSGFFEVACNTSFTPPRAFLAYNHDDRSCEVIYEHNTNTKYDEYQKRSSPVELFNISLETSEVRVYGGINSRCFTNYTEAIFKGKYILLDKKGPFLLSSTRNDLVGVGWKVEPSTSDDYKASLGSD